MLLLFKCSGFSRGFHEVSALTVRSPLAEIARKVTTIFSNRCNIIEKLTPVGAKKSVSRREKGKINGKRIGF